MDFFYCPGGFELFNFNGFMTISLHEIANKKMITE